MSPPTIRAYADELIGIGVGLSSAHPVGGKISDLARGIIHELDNSREITEKVTTISRGWRPESEALAARFVVTNHKARVVLDD